MGTVDMLIDENLISAAVNDVSKDGIDKALSQLADREPRLASYIGYSSTIMAGKLALSGAPSKVVRGVYRDALTTILVSIQALQTAHYELWKDVEGCQILGKLGEPSEPASGEEAKAGAEEQTAED